jgi:uncharacterized phage-like protein YoqJ
LIVAFTGHRPDKLGGYHPNPLANNIKSAIADKLLDLEPEKVISGMALGVDQWAAKAAHLLSIPFIAAIPFEGQELAWPAQSQEVYRELIELADEVVTVCDGGYAAWKMQKRNEFLVDHCDVLLAVWNGDFSGGTANCVRYAHQQGRLILRFDPVLIHGNPDSMCWKTISSDQDLRLLRRNVGRI